MAKRVTLKAKIRVAVFGLPIFLLFGPMWALGYILGFVFGPLKVGFCEGFELGSEATGTLTQLILSGKK